VLKAVFTRKSCSGFESYQIEAARNWYESGIPTTSRRVIANQVDADDQLTAVNPAGTRTAMLIRVNARGLTVYPAEVAQTPPF
jgi:hypothetical protein